MTVTNSRTRGRAPEMMGHLSEDVSNHDVRSHEVIEVEDGEMYHLEKRNGRKVFTKPRHDMGKGNPERWRAG